ncbi:hypothetical protein D3C72_1712610 [compost metagenome]
MGLEGLEQAYSQTPKDHDGEVEAKAPNVERRVGEARHSDVSGQKQDHSDAGEQIGSVARLPGGFAIKLIHSDAHALSSGESNSGLGSDRNRNRRYLNWRQYERDQDRLGIARGARRPA